MALLLALILMLALCACNDDGKKTSADNSGNNSDALSAESVSGSYSNAGGNIVNSVAWDEFYDSVSMDFKITAVNPNTILVSMGSLHFNAVIGQKMEVDFAGKTFHMVDRLTGEAVEIVVFVAILEGYNA